MSVVGKNRAAAVLGALAALGTAATASAIEPPRLKPPAPGPAFIARSDLSDLKAAKEAVERRDYAKARAIAADVADPTARSLAEWYYFEALDPQVSIEDADLFLDTHPDWPSGAKIQAHVESRMTSNLAPATALAFFDSRDPITGAGKLQLARAQFSIGAEEAGELHIKDAWINSSFTLPDEQRLLSHYGGRLSAEDHFRRADRLLFAREVTAAKRVFSKLKGADRKKAEARAALLIGAADAPRLYAHLSDEDRADPGVMLTAVRYFRRTGEEPRAISIAMTAPTDAAALRDPEHWWNEQNLLMRWALKNRQYADAYAMASHHGLEPGSVDFSEAEFDAGWIALRFLNDPARAEQHFAALTASVSAPISVSRGWYWLGRAAEAAGNSAAAAARYSKAAEQIYTFYGQLAAEKIGGPALMRPFESGGEATPEDKARFGSRPAVAALRMLTDIRDDRAFLIFSYHVDDQLESRGEFRELADLAMRMNAPHAVVRAGKVAVRSGSFAPDIAYPDIAVPSAASKFAPPEVILGLSRQESEFNPHAYSRAGARGVMQLIPSTAQATARKEGLKYNRSALLTDPHYNMTLGSAHLSHLIARFNGSWIMTFAAYNAGPHRVDQWIEDYGDPRDPGVDPLDWIEQIPFSETRNYVQRVLENSQIYRSRLTKASIAGLLARDIERGGAASRIGSIASIGGPGAAGDIQPRILALAEPVLAPPPAPVLEPPHAEATPDALKPKKQGVAKPARAPGRSIRRPGPRQKTPLAPPAEPAHDNALPAATTTPPSPPPPALAPPSPTPAAEAIDIPAPALSPAEVETLEVPGLSAAPTTPAAGEEAAAVPGECVTYSAFIAETAKEEASAADLNAGALAELLGDGAACE